MQKAYDILAIEITRRCNMRCAHCMRGAPERKDVDFHYIDLLLKDIEYISSLLITGGEPTLNAKAIRYIADVLRERGISLGGVSLITNGKSVPDDFISAYASLLSLSTDEECNYLAVSQDVFHEEIPSENRRKLSIFRAYQPTGHHYDWKHMRIVDLGRAKRLSGYLKQEAHKCEEFFYEYDPDLDLIRFTDTFITMTVDGDILPTCDYAFRDVKEWRIGHVSDPFWVERAIGLPVSLKESEAVCA